MAVTTKKLFPATSNSTTTDFSLSGLQLHNQDDLDVYVTKTTAGIAANNNKRILHFRQSTASNVDANHNQVNNTDGLYFPAITHTGGTETLENYQIVNDNGTVRFNSALPSGAIVFVERRTRDASGTYTSFASGSTIRAKDLNDSSEQSNFTAQEARNKAFTIEGVLFRGDQPSTNFVTSDHIVAGTIVTQDIADDSVNADKIPDDTINSEHYVDRSIDTQHIGANQVTTNELASNAVSEIKIQDNAVTTNKIADDAVTTAKFENISQNRILGRHDTGTGQLQHLTATEARAILNVENGATADQTSTEIKTLLQADKLTASEIAEGALDGRYYTEAESDARYFNISSGETIKDGDTFPDNDTTIATTAAINDRIIDIVNDVGGFDIIESEQHFPNTNPQGQAGSAAVLSIKAASGNLVPSGTTVTITNGNLANNANITITGVTSTIPSGFGFIVESTSTLHTYTFHRLVPNATEVTTVAGVASNVTTVAGISANVTTVAGISSNVTAVAGNASNINAVAGNAANINAVAADATDIGIVAADGTDIGLVAGSITNVNNVGGSIASVNTAASNLTSIANFGDQYQVASSAPSTDGGGNALAAGDLYFDTSANELRVHNGTTFQGGVTATGNLAGTGANTFTGNQTIQNTAPKLLLTDSDSNSDFSLWNSNGNFRIYDETNAQQRMVLASDGTFDFNSNVDFNSGIDVTGNITVSGNVDGRDIAADGNSLDNIEAGNIGTDVTNGNIKLTPNGTGVAEVRGAGGYDGTLQLNCSANSHGIKLKSPPHSAAQSYTLTFPSSIVNNGFLKTDSNGNLSFAAVNTDLVNDTSPQLGGTLASNGNNILMADNDEVRWGNSNDLIIHHDSSSGINSIKSNTGAIHMKYWTGSVLHNMAQFVPLGAVNLYHANNLKASTTSGGLNVQGQVSVVGSGVSLSIADNGKAAFGTSDDLKIYHDAGNNQSIIDNDTGTFIVRSDGGGLKLLSEQHIILRDNDDSTNMIRCLNGSQVELFYAGYKKFETLTDGAKVTGKLNAIGDNGITIEATSTNTAGQLTIIGVNNSNNVSAITRIKSVSTDSSSAATATTFSNRNSSNAVNEHMRIDSSGRVLIGTTSTGTANSYSNNLVVSEASGDAGISIHGNNSNSNYASLYLGDAGATSRAYLEAQLGSGTNINFTIGAQGVTRFANNGAERMRINSSGNVGIGTTSPSTKLHVNGTVTATSYAGDGSNLTGVSSDLVADTSPQLGGDLDLNGKKIAVGDGGDNANQEHIRFGNDGDLRIYHDATNSIIKNFTNDLYINCEGDDLYLRANDDVFIQPQNGQNGITVTGGGNVDLYAANSLKFNTQSGGVQFYGTLYGDDNNQIQLGNDQDFRIFHDGSYNQIRGVNNHNMYFYTNNTLRTVIQTDGHLRPASNNTYDLGTSVDRWRNIYTNDLNLSNEGSSNDMDGTWGNWTIQEGESDLFLKNNRSGKKYKFNLTEVT